MSPSRGRQQFHAARPRSEVFTAVGVSAGIVVGTAFLIWLMRPGVAGVPGGGGLFNRQPRMTILVLLTAAVLAGVVSYVLRRRHPPRLGTQGSIAVGSATTVVLAVVAGIFWPGGVIHHWPKQLKLPDVPTSPVPSTPTPTSAPKTGTTTKTGTTAPKTGTTAAPGTTVTPTSVSTTTTKAG